MNKRQNNIIESYFWVFVNYDQDTLARLLQIKEFIYNIVKTLVISHILYKLNCSFYI